MACKLCFERPVPKHYGSPRECAFDAEGKFTPDNWNCETINDLCGFGTEQYGDDECMDYVYCGREAFPDGDEEREEYVNNGGWIVMTRYKNRGCCSSAVRVGDFWPPEPLTLEVAEAVLAHYGLVSKAKNRRF